MIIVKGEFGGTCSNVFAILAKLLYARNLGEGSGHGTNAPCPDFLGMLCQTAAGGYAGATHMDDNLEGIPLAGGNLRCSIHPAFCKLTAFIFRKHISFTGRTVNENSLKSIARK